MDQVIINSYFFDLGGDSLCSIKLVSEVYSVLDVYNRQSCTFVVNTYAG